MEQIELLSELNDNKNNNKTLKAYFDLKNKNYLLAIENNKKITELNCIIYDINFKELAEKLEKIPKNYYQYTYDFKSNNNNNFKLEYKKIEYYNHKKGVKHHIIITLEKEHKQEQFLTDLTTFCTFLKLAELELNFIKENQPINI